MTNPVYESMTLIETSFLRVRVWREEADLMHAVAPENRDLHEVAANEAQSFIEVLERLGALPRVSAVEVLDKDGNGVVYYPDWK